MRVPLMDLHAQYLTIKPQIDAALQESIDTCAFIGGPQVKQFNQSYAKWLGVDTCVGVGNGTDALVIALKALNVGADDEVIVPGNSFIASSEAVTAVGGKVVFADCLPNTYTVDPAEIAKKITPQTKVIIAVHLYGYPAEMDEIMALAKQHNLYVLEDVAQAHGAEYNGKKAGSMGDLACFSFYPGKNLGAYGDAGAVCGSNPELMERVYMYANHGRKNKYNHEFEGINSRLDGMQAAVLNVKLPHLDAWNLTRSKLAGVYRQGLAAVEQLILPTEDPKHKHVYYVFTVLAQQRDELQAFLKDRDIATGIYYPVSLPFLSAYKHLGHTQSDFPKSFEYQSKILSLPMFAEMTPEQQQYVIDSVKEFYANS